MNLPSEQPSTTEQKIKNLQHPSHFLCGIDLAGPAMLVVLLVLSVAALPVPASVVMTLTPWCSNSWRVQVWA